MRARCSAAGSIGTLTGQLVVEGDPQVDEGRDVGGRGATHGEGGQVGHRGMVPRGPHSARPARRRYTPAVIPESTPTAPTRCPAHAGLPAPTHQPVQGWHSLLLVYAITSIVESMGVFQVFAFLPPGSARSGCPSSQVPTFTGLFSSLIFVFGIVLVPFWGVWADKYSRRAVIVRSAVVEAVVFAGVALAREPWQLAASLLLVGLQLGNTGVMLAALRDVTPRDRVGTVTALFGATEPAGDGGRAGARRVHDRRPASPADRCLLARVVSLASP